MDGVPEGFRPHQRKSPLTAPWEPIYAKMRADGLSLGLLAGDQHSNARGFVHGGLMSALADNAMGLSCGSQHDAIGSLVTVNLSVDFLGVAQQGQWLEFAASVHKVGRSLDFAQCLITADGDLCARATATFKVGRPKSN